MQRTFIVGCPRSGTTIVQAMLARHSSVFTLPETAFFQHLFNDLEWRWGDKDARPFRRRLRHRLGFTRAHGRHIFAELQRSLLGDESGALLSHWHTKTCAKKFIAMLDGVALQSKRTLWVEKTPSHLLYLPEIETHVPDAKIIHVIRRGTDVMASVVDGNLRFSAFSGDIALWVSRWNRAAQIHRAHIGQANHHFVFLEDLIRDSKGEWARLCGFLGLQPDISLDKACSQMIADVEREPWKHAAVHGVVRDSEHKVEDLFGPKLRHWLQTQLSSYAELREACAFPRHLPAHALPAVAELGRQRQGLQTVTEIKAYSAS